MGAGGGAHQRAYNQTAEVQIMAMSRDDKRRMFALAAEASKRAAADVRRREETTGTRAVAKDPEAVRGPLGAGYQAAPGCGGCNQCEAELRHVPGLHLERGCGEWDAAWAKVATQYGDGVCRNERSGEVWEYMGTHYSGGRWVHQFRHRDFTAADLQRERVYYDARATQGALWCERGRRIVG